MNYSKITCKLCGQSFHSLERHLLTAHEMKLHEYRTYFGLHYNTPLDPQKARKPTRVYPVDYQAIRRLREQGHRISEIMKHFGISQSAYYKAMRETKRSLTGAKPRSRCGDISIDYSELRHLRDAGYSVETIASHYGIPPSCVPEQRPAEKPLLRIRDKIGELLEKALHGNVDDDGTIRFSGSMAECDRFMHSMRLKLEPGGWCNKDWIALIEVHGGEHHVVAFPR